MHCMEKGKKEKEPAAKHCSSCMPLPHSTVPNRSLVEAMLLDCTSQNHPPVWDIQVVKPISFLEGCLGRTCRWWIFPSMSAAVCSAGAASSFRGAAIEALSIGGTVQLASHTSSNKAAQDALFSLLCGTVWEMERRTFTATASQAASIQRLQTNFHTIYNVHQHTLLLPVVLTPRERRFPCASHTLSLGIVGRHSFSVTYSVSSYVVCCLQLLSANLRAEDY